MSFSNEVPSQIFKLFDFVGKVLHTDISDGIPCPFIIFDLALDLKTKARSKNIKRQGVPSVMSA